MNHEAKKRIFVYPTGGQNIDNNPYVDNLKKTLGVCFELIGPNYKRKLPKMLVFMRASTKADVYVLNWIENSAMGRGGAMGGLMSMIGLWIIKIRNAKIVWICHNIHPHNGETKWSLHFKNFLFRYSTLIICHSQEAARYVGQHAKCPVQYRNHPLTPMRYEDWEGNKEECDFLYWGNILPYKGIVEFLSNPLSKISGRRIYVLGRCLDAELNKRIENLATDNIKYENREADFSEIAYLCRKARYVIFPYTGDSISSSGALMDTLLMGGTPVGPNRGAFADLARQGCCLTYDNIDDIFSWPIEKCIKLESDKVSSFIDNNSWNKFGQWIYDLVDRT